MQDSAVSVIVNVSLEKPLDIRRRKKRVEVWRGYIIVVVIEQDG